MDSDQGDAPEFTKGDTYESGDCGNFEAGINHLTLDGNVPTPTGIGTNPSKPPKMWWQRIAVYGNTAEQAEAMRDRVLAALDRASLPVGVPELTGADPVPDDYGNQASGYRAGWNDCRVLAAPAANAEQAPIDPSHRALIKNAVSLLRLRRPVAPDVERVASDLELMLSGHATPAGKPPGEWLEVAAQAVDKIGTVEIPDIVATFDGLYLVPIKPLRRGDHLMTTAQCLRIQKQLRAAYSTESLVLPTEAQLAEALNNVKCFHDLSAELIAQSMREYLAAMIPAGEQLWAVHAQGPDDLYAAFSREDAEKHAADLNTIPTPEGIAVSAVVIPSPWPAAEHWKYLAEQERDHAALLSVQLGHQQLLAADGLEFRQELIKQRDDAIKALNGNGEGER